MRSDFERSLGYLTVDRARARASACVRVQPQKRGVAKKITARGTFDLTEHLQSHVAQTWTSIECADGIG
jgi:hypothetical protein